MVSPTASRVCVVCALSFGCGGSPAPQREPSAGQDASGSDSGSSAASSTGGAAGSTAGGTPTSGSAGPGGSRGAGTGDSGGSSSTGGSAATTTGEEPLPPAEDRVAIWEARYDEPDDRAWRKHFYEGTNVDVGFMTATSRTEGVWSIAGAEGCEPEQTDATGRHCEEIALTNNGGELSGSSSIRFVQDPRIGDDGYATQMRITGAVTERYTGNEDSVQGARLLRRWHTNSPPDTDLPSADDPYWNGEANQPLPARGYYSTWMYFPTVYDIGVWFQIFQFKESIDGHGSQPVLILSVLYDADAGLNYFNVRNKIGNWRKSGFIDEHEDEPGHAADRALWETTHLEQVDPDNRTYIPVGEWFEVTMYFEGYGYEDTSLDQSSMAELLETPVAEAPSHTSSLRLWQDEELIVTGDNLRLRWSESESKIHWGYNVYSNGVWAADGSSPVGEATLYFDNAKIEVLPEWFR